MYKTTTSDPLKVTDFQLELIRQLCEKYCVRQKGRKTKESVFRLAARHFLRQTLLGNIGRKRCVV